MYQVRCKYCDVRLFDSSGVPITGRAVGIDVHIKCYKCRRMQRVTLAKHTDFAMIEVNKKTA